MGFNIKVTLTIRDKEGGSRVRHLWLSDTDVEGLSDEQIYDFIQQTYTHYQGDPVVWRSWERVTQ